MQEALLQQQLQEASEVQAALQQQIAELQQQQQLKLESVEPYYPESQAATASQATDAAAVAQLQLIIDERDQQLDALQLELAVVQETAAKQQQQIGALQAQLDAATAATATNTVATAAAEDRNQAIDDLKRQLAVAQQQAAEKLAATQREAAEQLAQARGELIEFEEGLSEARAAMAERESELLAHINSEAHLQRQVGGRNDTTKAQKVFCGMGFHQHCATVLEISICCMYMV